jgi:DNA-directed RNA polymerase subunit H (RpoH/RPB5)
MTESQYTQYKNIITFVTEWRKYNLTHKPVEMESFRKKMQGDQYILLDAYDPIKNKKVLIYLFDKNSRYTQVSQDLKKLLNTIKQSCTIMLIVYKDLNVYCRKTIAKFKYLDIITYRQEIFDLIIPNGPLCYPHRKLSREEVLKLFNDELGCNLYNISKIMDEDSQCIWIGAEVGDVVEINMLSDISGHCVQYKVVIPKSGRIISYKKKANNENFSDDIDVLEKDNEDYIDMVEKYFDNVSKKYY